MARDDDFRPAPMTGIVSSFRPVGPRYVDVEVRAGLRLTHRASGFTGTLVRMEKGAAVVRGVAGTERLFPLTPGAFAVDGKPATLVVPKRTDPPPKRTTASGSVAAPSGTRAKVARQSRILVEGVHDAELVEKVWGDDLRGVGVVVERLDGIDHLADVVAAHRPGPDARLGVLVDHLVAGSKEERIARSFAGEPDVLVTGTPYVDVWQAVRPRAAGISAWPEVPRGRPWKEGVCLALGHRGDPGRFWRQLLGRVSTYADLEPALVGAVERLIDFVTETD